MSNTGKWDSALPDKANEAKANDDDVSGWLYQWSNKAKVNMMTGQTYDKIFGDSPST